MIKRIYALMLVSLLAAGCSQSELGDLTVGGDSSSYQISFGLDADWTRGATIESTDDIPALEVYSYYATTAWDNITSSDDLQSYFTSSINTSFTLTNNGTTWSYTGGAQYWPNGSEEKLSFLTYYPDGELTHTVNTTTGKPEFSYTQSALANENDDIVYAALFDKQSSDEDIINGVVNLDLQHKLAKLTLKAMLKGECTDDTEYYTDVKYAINGITFYGLYSDASLTINSDGTTTWVIDDSKTIDVTATQGVTLISVDDAASALNGSTYTDVMIQPTAADAETGAAATLGQALFVLPQLLAAEREVAPTAKVRIRKTYKDKVIEPDLTREIIYETVAMNIPATDTDSDWKAGTHYVLSFAFDIGNLDATATPLTLTSTIYDWTETTVDVDVHPNIYIYMQVPTTLMWVQRRHTQICLFVPTTSMTCVATNAKLS